MSGEIYKKISIVKGEFKGMNYETSSRKLYPDFCKGVLIILVLVGHSIQFGLGNVYYSSGAYFDNFVYRAIYSFHMPAFMAISGYFWGMKLNRSCTIQTLMDKIKKLILPIFSWATIVTLITFVTQRINIVGCIKNEIVNFVFGLWFMWALIFCSILTFGVKKVSGKICSPAIVVVIALFLITPDILNFHLYKFVFPFFVMGGVLLRVRYQSKAALRILQCHS